MLLMAAGVWVVTVVELTEGVDEVEAQLLGVDLPLGVAGTKSWRNLAV